MRQKRDLRNKLNWSMNRRAFFERKAAKKRKASSRKRWEKTTWRRALL